MREYEHFRFKSSDGVHRCHFIVMKPDGAPRGVIQISHGMCEYIERYLPFMEYAAEQGFVVCGNDHLGHGKTADMPDELGYFSPKDGWRNTVKDLHRLTSIMKKQYPGLPYFMLGHSMGSFLARAYAISFGREIDAYIFMGTGDGFEAAILDAEQNTRENNPIVKNVISGREKNIGSMAITALLTAGESIKALRGEYYRSPLLAKMAFGKYNDRIENVKTGYEWVSRDEDVVERYSKDPLCNFSFTVNGYLNLASVLWYISNDRWYQNIPKDIPMLLMTGTEDPVGNYSEGVKIVYERMKDYKADADIKIYEGCRHELLNELNREEVYRDVIAFFESHLEKPQSEEKAENTDIPEE